MILEAILVASLCFTPDIRLPPSILRGPTRNLIYRNGESIILECKGTGVPDVTYEWKKNGDILNQTLQHILRGADGTITIQDATSMDEGFYQCFAENQYGTALSNTTHLQWAFLDSPPETALVLNKTVNAGKPFYIQCDPPRSFPTPTYSWEMANDTADEYPIPLQLSKRIQIAENGDLHFASAFREDERLYRCTAYNDYLGVKEEGSYTQVTVHPREVHFGSTLPMDGLRRRTYQWTPTPSPTNTTKRIYIATTIQRTRSPDAATTSDTPTTTPATTTTLTTAPSTITTSTTIVEETTTALTTVTAPAISDTPTPTPGELTPPAGIITRRRRRYLGLFPETQTVAVIGGSVTLRCFFYWNWRSTISWFKPGHTLPSGRYTLNNFNTSLTINNIAASDEGNYSCAAGWDQHTHQIRVEAVPLFPTVNDAPYDVNVTEGGSFTFRCNPVAKPEAKIVWLQDGKELDPDNPPERFVFSNDKKSLTIRDVCRDCVDRENKTDLMVIQCNASNVHGYAFAQGYLNVLRETKVTFNGERHKRQRIVIDLGAGKHVPLACRATSDPSTSPRVWWRRVENDWEQPVRKDPLIVTMKDFSLTFHVNRNATRHLTSYEAEYWCIADNGYSRDIAIVDIVLTGLCPRECSLRATWSQPRCKGCFDDEFKELLERVSDWNGTSLENQTVGAQIASQLSVLTNKGEGLSPGNLNASVRMLNRLADLRRGSTDNPNEKEITSFVEATSNVLRPINSEEWKELEAVNETFATAILSSVEVYGRSLSMLNSSGCNKKDEENLFLEAWSMEESSLLPPSEFPNCSAWDENKISLFTETLNSISSEGFHQPSYVWASYYPTIHNFLPGNKEFGNISSKVLSLSMDGLKPEEKLKRPVLITLQHNQERNMSFRRTCASWNFNRREWDSTGCSVMSTTLTHTICSCHHLTNFAILMSISDASMTTHASDHRALSILSYIGCSISVVALILTIIVYALTWQQSKSAQAAVLLNLSVALIIGYIIFMAGADKVKPEDGCIVVAVLLHYFFLAAFFIMLIEGVELLLYIIFVFHVRRTRETIMLIASAWVLPLVIVSASLGSTKLVGYGNYGNDGNGQVCWLSSENGLIWAFAGPVLFIVTVNIVILAIVLRWMSKRRSFLASNEKKRSEMRATLWNMAVTCPVLGLGWLFGIFSLTSGHVVFQYLFVIANSLQGLLIFIFHALFHNKTAKEKISYIYSNYICGWRKTVSDDSNKMSSTQEPAKKTEKPGFVPIEVHDNKGMEKGDILLGTGTLTTSIGDSSTLESTHM